jgi:hypothetical protein
MNRVKRIFLPFLILWLVPFAFAIMQILPMDLYKPNTIWMDLNYIGSFWFLYFLILFDAILLGFLRFFPSLTKALSEKFSNNNFRVSAVLMLLGIFSALFSGSWFTSTSINLIPNFSALIFYAVFFIFGALMASVRLVVLRLDRRTQKKGLDPADKPQDDGAEATQQQFWPLGFLFSFILMGIYWWLYRDFQFYFYAKLIGAGIWALLPWLMMPTLFFLFQSIAAGPNKIWRYLADSSYWIYIAQLPVLGALSLIFYYEKFSVLVAVPAMSASSLAILLLSYQLLIRKRPYLNYIDGARS